MLPAAAAHPRRAAADTTPRRAAPAQELPPHLNAKSQQYQIEAARLAQEEEWEGEISLVRRNVRPLPTRYPAVASRAYTGSSSRQAPRNSAKKYWVKLNSRSGALTFWANRSSALEARPKLLLQDIKDVRWSGASQPPPLRKRGKSQAIGPRSFFVVFVKKNLLRDFFLEAAALFPLGSACAGKSAARPRSTANRADVSRKPQECR